MKTVITAILGFFITITALAVCGVILLVVANNGFSLKKTETGSRNDFISHEINTNMRQTLGNLYNPQDYRQRLENEKK